VTEKDLGTLIETGLKGLANQIEQLQVEVRQTQVQVESIQVDVRQTQVQIESVRGDIKQLAEGIANVEEKLDRHVKENIRQFDDVRALMRISYVQIEQRVSTLEDRYDEMNARLTALESTRH
jgi:chromosome segregation ATPase